MWFGSGEVDARGTAGDVDDVTGREFMPWDQMTQHLDDYLCSAEVRAVFRKQRPERPPRTL